jgi:hypothetical protein
MNEINDMIVNCKKRRVEKVEELIKEMQRLKVEPEA